MTTHFHFDESPSFHARPRTSRNHRMKCFTFWLGIWIEVARLTEFDIIVHQWKALWLLYQTSFESNRIQVKFRPQITAKLWDRRWRQLLIVRFGSNYSSNLFQLKSNFAELFKDDRSLWKLLELAHAKRDFWSLETICATRKNRETNLGKLSFMSIMLTIGLGGRGWSWCHHLTCRRAFYLLPSV